MQKIIGLVHTRFSPIGGVENYIGKLVPALLERNWQIHYFTARVDQPVPPGMRIHKIPVIRGTSISRMLSFAYGARRAVRAAQLPLVMGFGRTIDQDIYRDGSGCLRDYQKYAGQPLNPFYRKSYLHLERKRFQDQRLQKVLAVSHMVRDQIIQRYRLPPAMVEVVYSGVNAQNLHPGLKRRKRDFRKLLNIPEQARVILLIGNGFERKGVPYLIKAVSQLPIRLPFVAVVAGQDKRIDHYRQLTAESGCAARIRFVGYQANTAALYGAADLFVLPSRFDPIANVVLEALYTGTPVITGPQVGAGELIQNGVNGFVVSDYEPTTLSRAILACYEASNQDEMARRAHQAAAPYCWDLHVARLETIFLQVMGQKTNRGTRLPFSSHEG
ncbi:MAG: glycosyltransferase family 4 protein [Desulfobacterales bacterium]|nr:MAG: glycosyltransferase family 4 protein [Desulfobacterales bacterium]